MNRLLVKFKDRTIKEFALDHIDTFSIGRSAKHDITIDNCVVSTNHAVIKKEGNLYIIKDTNSKNGTFLNGLSVDQAILKNGDIITIGKHSLVFLDRGRLRPRPERGGLKTSGRSPDPGPDHTMFMDTEVYRRMLSESGNFPELSETQADIVFLSGGSGRINLEKSRVTIGKSDQCDIVIGGIFSLLAGDPAAVISKTPQHHYVNAVDGWIKTRVNGQVIRGPVRLKNKDIIKVGTVVLQYISDDTSCP